MPTLNLLKKSIVLCLFVVTANSLQAQSWVHNPDWWVTNGPVNAVEIDSVNELVYISGNFNRVGPPVDHGAILDTSAFPLINEYDINFGVKKVIAGPDKSWFIGGYFDEVGECTRKYIAHLDSLGKPTEMFTDLGLNGLPDNLYLRDSLLYICGSFNNVGKAQKFCAFYESGDTLPDFLQAEPNGPINEIIDLPEGGWYMGGDFTSFGDSARNSFVYLNADKSINSWAPQIDGGAIETMLLVGDTLFVGGSFEAVNGQERLGLAAFNRQSGALLAWNPNADSWVLDLDHFENRIIICGYFDSINLLPRNGLASVNRTTGLLDSWNPNPQYLTKSIAINDNILYVGGDFTSIAGQSRTRLASFNLSTNALTSWNPNVNDEVEVVEADDDYIFIGGSFNLVSGQSRGKLAVFNTVSGTLTSNQFSLSGGVCTIKRIENDILIGGGFQFINSERRSYFAKLNLLSNTIDPWNLTISSDDLSGLPCIKSISTQGNELLLGGNLDVFGGVNRNSLAVFNINSGELEDFNIIRTGYVSDFLLRDSLLILIGSNITINGQTHQNVSVYNLNSNTLLPFNPIFNLGLGSIHNIGDTLYLGGNFTTVDGISRIRLSAFDMNSWSLLNWSPSFDDNVSTLESFGDSLFVGGVFDHVNGQNVKGLACISASNANLLQWGNNTISGSVYDLQRRGSELLISGTFDTISGYPRDNFGIWNVNQNDISAFQPNPSGYVFSSAFNDDKIYLGGQFNTVGTLKRNRMAAIDLNTGIFTDWAPNAPLGIKKIIALDDRVFVSGAFNLIEGQIQWGFTEFSALDGSLAPFDLELNGTVYDMEIKDSLLFLSGFFTTAGGQNRTRLASFNLNTNSLRTWDPQVHEYSYPLVMDIVNDKIYISDVRFDSDLVSDRLIETDLNVGNVSNSYLLSSGEIKSMVHIGDTLVFTSDIYSFDGSPVNNVSFFDLQNQQIIPYDPMLSVYSIDDLSSYAYSDKLYLHGNFYSYQGFQRENIAEVDFPGLQLTQFNPFENANSFGVKDIKRTDNKMVIASYAYMDEWFYRNHLFFEKCNLPITGPISGATEVCLGDTVHLTLSSGTLNDATNWVWYKDDIGCDPIGYGTTYSFVPEESAIYYVRGEGGCVRKEEGSKIIVRLDYSEPVISNCPANQVITHNSPGCTAIASWLEPTALDNCPGSLLVEMSHSSGSVFQQGITPVYYIFTDSIGNASTCSFTIEIIHDLLVDYVTTDIDCFGESSGEINTTPSGGSLPYTFSWNGGMFSSEDLVNIPAGIYDFTFTDADACEQSETIIVTQANPLNTNVIVSGNSLICTNTSLGVSYAWVDCNNGNSIIPGAVTYTYTVISNGSYAVQITQNGCSNIGTCYDFDNIGMDEYLSENIILHPNPTSGLFSITGLIQPGRILIKDIHGKQLIEESLDPDELLDLSEVPNGVYLVQVFTQERVYFYKLIKM